MHTKTETKSIRVHISAATYERLRMAATSSRTTPSAIVDRILDEHLPHYVKVGSRTDVGIVQQKLLESMFEKSPSDTQTADPVADLEAPVVAQDPAVEGFLAGKGGTGQMSDASIENLLAEVGIDASDVA